MFADRTNWNLAKNRLSEALERHRRSGRPLLDLTASNPTECGFEYRGAEILQALGNPAALRYEPEAKGLLAAREAVEKYYAGRGARVPAEDIVMTTSTSEAYTFAMRLLCNPGDELVVPSPSYPLFDFLADIQDVMLARYALFYDHGWEIDFASLASAITDRTRGIIVVHPNNPTGHFAKAGEAARLNEICTAQGLALIADEVFLDYALDEKPRESFAGNRGALTFTMSGLSKICGLPQMKAAWMATSGPEETKRAALERLEIVADTFLSVSAPVQWATPKMLEHRGEFQRQLLERVQRNMAEADRQLSQQRKCARLRAEGGWYAVLRVPATRADEDLAIALLESSGVYVHPGHFYDFPSDGHLVVSAISPEGVFAEGLKRLLASI